MTTRTNIKTREIHPNRGEALVVRTPPTARGLTNNHSEAMLRDDGLTANHSEAAQPEFAVAHNHSEAVFRDDSLSHNESEAVPVNSARTQNHSEALFGSAG